ncbi:hypothetical protein CTAYLR_002752 [Chrysophaeum taylorii]|uniref:V-type proton ATPase subunit C n=1 Tax=Chrysophaeum taylorii TaxID=2483200 RepID=A0AAD7UDJ2_9STRA|nr:hypothetical protein CTAYLR_002752 [Chrysophaeum taylorii]
MSQHPFWLVTVPNEGRSGDETFERLRRHTDESSKGYLVQIPSLTVGTLDSLMALSDDMEKVDSAIEVTVRKIERQYGDIAASRSGREPLLIDGVPVERYLPSFVWEHAKYPHRRALPELVGSLRTTVGSIEDELKQLTVTFADKTQKLQGLSRSKKGAVGAAAASMPLEELLPPEAVADKNFLNTEYLVTMVSIVPRQLEQRWLDVYATGIAAGLVDGEGTCSPAVPGSSERLYADQDVSVWSVTLLKGRQLAGKYGEGDQWVAGQFVDFVAAYVAQAKDLHFTVRPYEYDAERVAKNDRDREDLSKDVERLHGSILRWCKAHFSETFVAWMHLKVIRAFVESVLRYGLPVDFITALLVPLRNREPQLQASLDKMFGHLKAKDLQGPAVPEDDKAAEYHPYVLQKCFATSL